MIIRSRTLVTGRRRRDLHLVGVNALRLDRDVMTADDDALYRDIRTMLKRHAPAGVELAPTTELSGDLNIDSVTAMDLIMEIEDKFGIDIPMNLVSDLRNLQDLVDVVREQSQGR